MLKVRNSCSSIDTLVIFVDGVVDCAFLNPYWPVERSRIASNGIFSQFLRVEAFTFTAPLQLFSVGFDSFRNG